MLENQANTCPWDGVKTSHECKVYVPAIHRLHCLAHVIDREQGDVHLLPKAR
jgi:hypothetical protein